MSGWLNRVCKLFSESSIPDCCPGDIGHSDIFSEVFTVG